jgi:hypothetical protein
MRIAVSADNRQGLDSVVRPHFGRCPYYVLVDVVGHEVTGVQEVDSPFYGHLSWPKNAIHVGNGQLGANNPNGSSLLSYRYSNGCVYSARTIPRLLGGRRQLIDLCSLAVPAPCDTISLSGFQFCQGGDAAGVCG